MKRRGQQPVANSQHGHTFCCFSTCQKQPLWRFHTLRSSLLNYIPMFEWFLLLGKAKVTQQLNTQDVSSGEIHRGFIASLCGMQQVHICCSSLPSQVTCLFLYSSERPLLEGSRGPALNRVEPVKVCWLDLPELQPKKTFKTNLSQPAEQTDKS